MVTPPETIPTLPAPPAPKASPQNNDRLKYLSILAALIIVAATTVALYSISAVRQSVQSATDAFQPQIKYTTILSGAIGQLNNTPKLVVLTPSLTASVTQESVTRLFGVNVSSAKVEVIAPAKVIYTLKLKDIGMNDIYYDELNKRLVVSIPRPMLDTDIVEVESDPSKIQVRTELGWSPLSIFKGGAVRDEAMKHLKESAIEQGRNELLQERAEKNAKETVAELLGKVKDAMKGDGVRLEVEFKKQ